MNKFIEKELNSCRVANIPLFDSKTTHMQILKNSGDQRQLCVNGCYLVKFGNMILKEPEGFTLSVNWNNNTKPLTPYNKVQVLQVAGKMVRLECVGYDYRNQKDLNNTWTGWVPMKLIDIVKVLE